MLLDQPNLLRRAAVALVVGVTNAELKPLAELAEEAEGATEGRPVLPTCKPATTNQPRIKTGAMLFEYTSRNTSR